MLRLLAEVEHINGLGYWKPHVAMMLHELRLHKAWLELPVPRSQDWDPAFLDGLSPDYVEKSAGRDWYELFILLPDDWERSGDDESSDDALRARLLKVRRKGLDSYSPTHVLARHSWREKSTNERVRRANRRKR